MAIGPADPVRGSAGKTDGYSLALQVARVRAAYQRSYFAPALFSLVPVETDLIGSMAVDSQWRLYYNDAWLTTHTVEEKLELVAAQAGFVILPRSTTAFYRRPDVRVLPIQDIGPSRVTLIWDVATDNAARDAFVSAALACRKQTI